MRTSVVKWGNSQGIRLSKVLLNTVNINENDDVDVTTRDNEIVIKKARYKHKTTAERLKEFYGEGWESVRIEQWEEVDWGKPVGDEVW